MSPKLKKGRVPLYCQLERALCRRILAGKYSSPGRFPTERQIGEDFRVSRITVRQALAILENEGLILREQGRGTFVAGGEGARVPYTLYGYVDDLFLLGAQSRLELRGKKAVPADAPVASDLRVQEGERVFLFEGLRHFEGGRRAYFQAHLPEELGARISPGDLHSAFLIQAVEKVSRERVKKAHQTVTAEIATARLAAAMKLKAGHPLLVVKRVYYSTGGRALERAVTHFPGDFYQTAARLGRIVS